MNPLVIKRFLVIMISPILLFSLTGSVRAAAETAIEAAEVEPDKSIIISEEFSDMEEIIIFDGRDDLTEAVVLSDTEEAPCAEADPCDFPEILQVPETEVPTDITVDEDLLPVSGTEIITEEVIRTDDAYEIEDSFETADSYLVFEKTLSKGMKGNDVLLLQQRLYELGYLTVQPDGIYGNYTVAAVNAFQKANGLSYQDGKAGSWTIEKLNHDPVSAETKDTAGYDPISISRNLSKGMTGQDVLAVQQALYDLKYLTVQPDGIFGRYTEAAVNAFQLANGLGYSDGIVGKWTTAKLNEITGAGTPAPSARVLNLWMKGDDVLEIQQKLYDLGYLSIEPDGHFGIKTLAAVNMFQLAHGMKTPDGKIGPWTLAKLENNPVPLDQASVFTQSGSSDNMIEFTRILQKGMIGKDIYEVQKKLHEQGYLSAKPDGRFGDHTLAAVKAFQKANGLADPDGLVGKWTIGKLNGSSSPGILSGDQITWIGDSLTASAGEGIFRQWFPGADYGSNFDSPLSYIEGGKKIKETDQWNPAGLTLLRNITENGRLRPYLVFELGTNEYWADNDGKDRGFLDELRTLAGNETQIILVTVETNHESYEANNAFLFDAEKRYSNIYVADWSGASRDEYFLDGLHFNYAGTKAFFNVIRDSLLESAIVGAMR